MPPATAGPGPSIDAPLPGTPFSVWNSRFVSYAQTIEPSLVEYARSAPSTDPEKTIPEMTVMAADCAALQPRPAPHVGGGAGVCHARSPSARVTACKPPGFGRVMSDTGKYACSASTAEPHSMPPRAPPWPARYCHSTPPFLSGSIANPTPDFWPITIASLPLGS